MAWRAICDVCGFKLWNHELRKRWDGLMVCSADFEKRHPQDFVKAKPDRQNTPWVRPEPDDIDVSVGSGNEVTSGDL